LGKGAALIALAVFFLSEAAWLPKRSQENFHGSYLVSPLTRFGETLIRMGKERMGSSADREHAALRPGGPLLVFPDDQPEKDRRDPRPRFDRRSDLGLRDFEKGRAQPSRP